MLERIITCVIAIILGGVLTPIFICLFCDKKGWFK